MKKYLRNILLIAYAFLFTINQNIASESYPQIEVKTTSGSFIIELDRNRSPISVENFLRYIEDDFFENTVFHRVIQGFVIQGGGYTPDLESKETYPNIINESGNGLSNRRMTIAMARETDPHTASSQFYINLVDNFTLDPMATRWGYAVFGEVIEGFSVINSIAGSATQSMNGMQDVPVSPVIILEASRIN
ncbi:MAG: peptidyl-prolyl cis-trans isomerase [Gammaproteobacteria bacterium]|jgi:cyclophilin family peptidyl-prolyl cis-trans isomerase|nr:peptidyl-prolyl cis-trans isomerase [Gammaproteobacteria bacterium]MBT5217594.1 peptidyl-prolyl cis-trans isomerase [Gammaproteobacteria bacterium]MBT5542625.1 peptidyl-prolyl cis-trans isomerase [Gammaproteobacteria bacterium]MBT6073336.1 peptidyl-prolyl cis-trans isomerase [Gammaproteobacteria bacterium]MBT7753757.1 peptidyl-prolyl cis-trans isomerase [Gammaproteobacteria bacterium]